MTPVISSSTSVILSLSKNLTLTAGAIGKASSFDFAQDDDWFGAPDEGPRGAA
jgi:hypothetical protein